jgi:hypothetical protein
VYPKESNVEGGSSQLTHIETMDSITYHAIEKNAPIWSKIQPHEPTKARRSRVILVKALAIAIVLFIWALYYSVPGLVGSKKEASAIHAEVKDGFTFDDFDSVSSFSLPYHIFYKADFLRSPQVRS